MTTDKSIEQEAEREMQGFEYRASLEDFAKRAYIKGRSQELERIKELEEEVKKYVGITEAFMKVSKEVIQLRAFVADVLRGQHGELKGDFIARIRRQARDMTAKLNRDMQSNGASQEKPNQGTNDGKIKKP